MGASTMRGLLLASAVVLSGSVANAEEGTAQKARQFLEKHCARCHAGGQDEGGLDCALDGRRLVETKRVVPGHAGDSELFRLVSTKKMPDDTETKPTDDEVADLKRWIDEGAPAFGATAAFVSPEQVLATIKADVLALDKADRPFARYLTLVHLANAGRSPDEIVAHTKALSKLLNGLSWKKEIAVPTAVGAEKTILRIDLRKYDWTAATWQAIAAAYPYGTVPEGVAKDCAAETGSESFAIRGDWFLANVARPPLYHAILQLPGTDKEIEKLLGVDVAANIASYAARRAGSYQSGESDYNRVVERHPTKNGAYWKSYDVRDGDHQRDFFPNPLGPGSGERDLVRDGSEIIFTLPNGLLAYMVVDQNGARLDHSPPGTCWNKRARDGSITTVNGIGCMSCHTRGPTALRDGVRGWYTGHAIRDKTLFDKKLLETVCDLYAEGDEMRGLFEQDEKTYKTAVEQAGARLPKRTEPLAALASEFESALDRKLAAAELGLSPEAFLGKLKATPVAALAPLSGEGATVARSTFQKAFPEALKAWSLGKHDGHEQAPYWRETAAGLRRYETAVSDGILSVELDASWTFEGRRTGLVLEHGNQTRFKLSAGRTKLKNLDALSAHEKETLAQRLQEIKPVEHPQLGHALSVRYEGPTPNVQCLDRLVLVGSWLARLSTESDAKSFDRDRPELERVMAAVRLEAPEELDPIHPDLPAKLKAAGFESDYNAALARAKAEGKLIVLFIKPARSNFT